MTCERGRSVRINVYINLPVGDLDRSRRFFQALGFSFNDAFGDDTALANGAGAVREPEDHGFMYGHAFADPDGHIWEPFWMNPDAMDCGQ